MSTTAGSVVVCRTLLGTYPTTAALKRGAVPSSLVSLDFAGIDHVPTAFKALVRDGEFDVGELAIVTYLQARVFRKPYVLLPAVIAARHQDHSLFYNPARGPLVPSGLATRRIGVRAYTQTTGVWLRSILEEDYGIDFRTIRWVTFEDPHLAEYVNPPWVDRAPAGKRLRQMLLDGELDAAVFGGEGSGPPLTGLIRDPDAAAARWAERHGGTPISHMIVVRDSLSRERPDVVREIFRLLLESQKAAGIEGRSLPGGVEPLRTPLEAIIEFAFRQRLIPRRLSVDELFDETTRALGNC